MQFEKDLEELLFNGTNPNNIPYSPLEISLDLTKNDFNPINFLPLTTILPHLSDDILQETFQKNVKNEVSERLINLIMAEMKRRNLIFSDSIHSFSDHLLSTNEDDQDLLFFRKDSELF